MKLSSPRLSPQLQSATVDDLVNGDAEEAVITGGSAANVTITALDLADVRLEKVVMTAAQCERINARDVVVKGCELSAVNFSNGSWNRTEFLNCRLTGADFSKTSLHDVVFKDCRLDMMNFRFADLRRVRFVDCDMNEADFLQARLVDVTFETSHLEKTVFEGATCTRADLRSSQLTDIVGWKSLKGATIDHAQLVEVAPYLAHELGVAVRNN